MVLSTVPARFANLLYEQRDAIVRITVNRPQALNVLNAATMDELRASLTAAKDDPSVRVLLLTGAGEKAFVAGADINELATQDAVGGKEYTHRGQAVIDLVETLGKPVIACVNGYALGGGCELAMACTLRLASDNARFAQPEVKLGLIPGYGGTQRLPRLIGKGMALQQLLTGDMITAAEAHRIGLVNEVMPLAELLPRGEALARKIAANAPLAVRYVMEAVQRGMEMSQPEGLYVEAALFGLCCTTEDMKEGTRAFLEKRPPKFQGK